LPYTIAQFGKDGKRNLGVVERDGAVGQNLFFLVAFAGKEDDVAGFRRFEREPNRRGAIDFDGVRDIG
jgi:hypothetical protein